MELAGMKFSRLTVIERTARRGKDEVWICRCDCGKVKPIRQNVLRSGNTRSCGCLRTERLVNDHKTHGMSKTLIYASWLRMIARCIDPNCQDFPGYGGRGITVCERWMKFENFFADMGERPKGKSLDRRNNDGNYDPENCHWATPTEQSSNKRSTIRLTAFGKTMMQTEWAKLLGVTDAVIHNALKRGENLGDYIERRGYVERAGL